MAKANLKGALKTEKIGNFTGICLFGEGKKGLAGASDCANFRILPDGSLEKREGYVPLMTLRKEPRAFWSGFFDGEETTLALMGDGVYKVDFENSSETLIGRIETSEGGAEFFFCDGRLFLSDGKEFYVYDGAEFNAAYGYIPLYAVNLSEKGEGAIYEDINYLSDMVRLHFSISSAVNKLHTELKCTEIISAVCEGREYADKMEITDEGKTLSCIGSLLFTSGSQIYVTVRLAPEEISRERLTSCRRGTAYGGSDDARMLLYCGTDPSEVFVSKRVSAIALSESRVANPEAEPFYFPHCDVIRVSYGRYPVTGLCRHYDRLLVFTTNETWLCDLTKKDTDYPYIIPMNSGVGCLSERGAVLGGNNPYTLSEGGIYRWETGDDERDECNAFCISGAINAMLSPSFFRHGSAYYNRAENELWFADTDSEEQNVFVYLPDSGKWFRFSGIPADFFFSYGGRTAMIYGKYVFVFDIESNYDVGAGGGVREEIYAFYESNTYDFDIPEYSKHLKRVLAKAECAGDSLTLEFLCDRGGRKLIAIEDSGSDSVKYKSALDAKIDIGRFKSMHYRIEAAGNGRAKVSSLTLAAYK